MGVKAAREASGPRGSGHLSRLTSAALTLIFLLVVASECRSVVSDSLRPRGTRQSMEFSRPEYWSK